MKRKIAVFFGGRSVEHDVSVVTGLQLIENIDNKKYDVLPVYIARNGHWYTGDKLLDISFVRRFDPNSPDITPVYLPPVPDVRALLPAEQKKAGLFGKKSVSFPFDIALPAMHGMNGEDGTLQGLFELADIPYVGSGILGSSVGMDKILMKSAFKGAGFPVLDSEWFLRDEWEADPDVVIKRIEDKLDYPIFIKPANLGSSIGIGKADDRDALYEVTEIAVRYDRRILADKGVTEISEYNCSVLGCGNTVRASVCEQPVSWKDFLSFDDKYLRSSKEATPSTGMKSMNRMIPAPISDELTSQIQQLSCDIFKLFDCSGVVRIDYIFDNSEQKLYVNEINTIPGSFAFYLWENGGINYPRLIDELIESAMLVHKEKNRNVYAFDSDMLKKSNLGAKGSKS